MFYGSFEKYNGEVCGGFYRDYDRWLTDTFDPNSEIYAIELRETGERAGFISFLPDEKNRSGRLDVFIKPEMRCMRGVPSEKLSTRRPVKKANSSASTEPTKVANTRYFSIPFSSFPFRRFPQPPAAG